MRGSTDFAGMGDERRDDADQRRADVYSSARIGAAAALTLVRVVLLVFDVAAPEDDISPGILLPLLGAILAVTAVILGLITRSRVSPASATHVRDGHLRGTLPRKPTARQVDVLAAFVAVGGSVAGAAQAVGIRPSTAKRHLADLRARSGLTTEQLIYHRRAEGWLVVPGLEPT